MRKIAVIAGAFLLCMVVLTSAGCLGEDYYTPTISKEEAHNANIKFNFEGALNNNYRTLSEDIESFIGRPVIIYGKVTQVVYDDSEKKKCHGLLKLQFSSQTKQFYFYYNGDGRRITEDGKYIIYGEVRGLTTYQNVLGQDITVPAITVVDLESSPY